MLRKDTTDELEWKNERDNLRLFTEQRHGNIVRALFFYEWREHISFVFPFIEGTLEKLLKGQWNPLPEFVQTLGCDQSPTNWLWIQIVGVAEGLSVIHNPQSPIFKGFGTRGVGFHFDLKPANILITDKGELKISDFGLSMIKRVRPSSRSYGIFRGGAPRYQPPEVAPVLIPPISSPMPPWAESPDSKAEEVKNNYDVWSFACIVVEILIFIFDDDGTESLERFEKAMESEPPGQAFHGVEKPKECVLNAMKRLCSDDIVATKAHGFKPWAYDLTQLLTRMFHFEPEHRPSSRQVVEDLKRLQEDYTTEPEDAIKAALRQLIRQEYPQNEYNEIRWGNQHSDYSFIQMFVLSPVSPYIEVLKPDLFRDGISFSWPKSSDESLACRLIILLHKEKGNIKILRCYENPNISTLVQSCKVSSLKSIGTALIDYSVSPHGAHLIPLSAYDPRMRLSCIIYESDGATVRYTFESEHRKLLWSVGINLC